MELCQVFPVRELVLELLVARLIHLKFPLDALQQVAPLLFKQIAFLQTVPDLSFVLLGVGHDLGFTFIVDFDLQLALARPLGSEALVELVN